MKVGAAVLLGVYGRRQEEMAARGWVVRGGGLSSVNITPFSDFTVHSLDGLVGI